VRRLPHLLVVLGVVTAASAGRTPASSSVPQPDEPRAIEVTVRRFAFEPEEIHVREGERVRLLVRSADGLHGFGIKAFGLAHVIPRGTAPVVIELTPDRTGRFEILCTEFCGEGHDRMRGLLVVQASAAEER
jgi:cytochrome c oxidase subunit II